MITIWNNVNRTVSEVKVKAAVEGSLKVRLWQRIVTGLKHMEAPHGIAVCGKRLIAEETLQFRHMLRLDMSVQRVPFLIRGSAHAAGVLSHIPYTKQSGWHSLNVQ